MYGSRSDNSSNGGNTRIAPKRLKMIIIGVRIPKAINPFIGANAKTRKPSEVVRAAPTSEIPLRPSELIIAFCLTIFFALSLRKL